jgi:hypothetical protein
MRAFGSSGGITHTLASCPQFACPLFYGWLCSGRKLKQQAQTLLMAPVYPYDASIMAKATRLARYAAAIHGCLPSTPGKPQTYTALDGSTQ